MRTTAPTPVVTAQPSDASRSMGTASVTLTSSHSGTTVCCEKVAAPCSIGSPSSVWKRVLPSIRRPSGATMPLQRLGRPLLQYSHQPHIGRIANTTWSPGSNPLTPGPSPSTTPAPSCPITKRERMALRPSTAW